MIHQESRVSLILRIAYKIPYIQNETTVHEKVKKKRQQDIQSIYVLCNGDDLGSTIDDRCVCCADWQFSTKIHQRYVRSFVCPTRTTKNCNLAGVVVRHNNEGVEAVEARNRTDEKRRKVVTGEADAASCACSQPRKPPQLQPLRFPNSHILCEVK